MVMMSAMCMAQVEWKDRYVTLADSTQGNPTIAQPASGGYTVIVWEDYRNGEADVYAQKIDNENGIAMWFPIDGVPVCTVSGEQRNPRAAFDEQGGVIITWEDYRSGYSIPAVWATRLLTANGTEDTTWAGGVLVAGDSTYSAFRPRIVGARDGAFITWTDNRNTAGWPATNNNDVYAQYLLSDSAMHPRWMGSQWTANGIRVNVASDDQQQYSEIILDSLYVTPGGRCGIVVAYEGKIGNDRQIMMEHLDSSGMRLWSGQDLQIAPNHADQYTVKIAPAGMQDIGGDINRYVVATWQDDRNRGVSDVDVCAQFVNIDSGTPQWPNTTSPVGLEIVTEVDRQLNPDVIVHEGKAAIVWEDLRAYQSNQRDVYANMVELSTQILAMPTGVEICTEEGDQQHVCLYVAEGQDELWIGWEDWRSESNIYYQRLDWTGFSPQLQNNGWPVTQAKGEQTEPVLGCGVFVFSDTRRMSIANDTQADQNIYAQSPGSECDTPTNMHWKDEFAKWTPGVEAREHRFVVDGEGSTYVVWVEDRVISAYNINHPGAYAQKFDKDGVPRWGNDGVYLNITDGDSAATPDLCLAGNGGALFAWRKESDIVTTLVDASGAIVDQQVLTSNSYLESPRLAAVPNGVYLVCLAPGEIQITYSAWNGLIFPQLETAFNINGITDPRIVSDGFGGCYVLGRAPYDVYHKHYRTIIDYTQVDHFHFTSTGEPSYGSYDVVMDTEGSPASANDPYDAIVAATNGTEVCAFKIISSGSTEYTWPPLSDDCVIEYGGLHSHVSVAADKIGPQANLGGAIVVWDNYDYSQALGEWTHSVETQRASFYPGYVETFWKQGYPLKLTPVTQLITQNTQPDITCIQPDSARHLLVEDDQCFGVIVWRDDRDFWCGNGTVVVSQFVNYMDPIKSSSLLWGANGIQVSPQAATLLQEHPQVEVHSGIECGTSFLCQWMDTRTGSACVAATRFEDVSGQYQHAMAIMKHPANVEGASGTFRLDQSYPNPVSIRSGVAPQMVFVLPSPEYTELRLYDMIGRCVFHQAFGMLEQGTHTAMIPQPVMGGLVPGVYRCELNSGDRRLTRLMVVTQ